MERDEAEKLLDELVDAAQTCKLADIYNDLALSEKTCGMVEGLRAKLITALTGSDRPEVNLRKEIINIQVDVEKMTQACEMEYNPEFRDEWIYKLAHRDCRHAAAEIVAGRWRKVEP